MPRVNIFAQDSIWPNCASAPRLRRCIFCFSSRRRHTRYWRDWSSDVCSSDLLRGKFMTDAKGHFGFRSVKPAGYPIPIDGPVGDLLRVAHRHNYRPAHLHFLILKEGFKTLISQIYVPDDDKLETDAQFGVTRALIGDYIRHDGPAPVPDVKGEWYSLDQTFVMEAGKSQLPKPPID